MNKSNLSWIFFVAALVLIWIFFPEFHILVSSVGAL